MTNPPTSYTTSWDTTSARPRPDGTITDVVSEPIRLWVSGFGEPAL